MVEREKHDENKIGGDMKKQEEELERDEKNLEAAEKDPKKRAKLKQELKQSEGEIVKAADEQRKEVQNIA